MIKCVCVQCTIHVYEAYEYCNWTCVCRHVIVNVCLLRDRFVVWRVGVTIYENVYFDVYQWKDVYFPIKLTFKYYY